MNSGFYIPLQHPMFIVNSEENPTFFVRQNIVQGQTQKHWIRTKPMDPSEPETMQYFYLGEGSDCARGKTGGSHTGGREAAQH
jgi:hypothetical protein